jgi:hypothetical protein
MTRPDTGSEHGRWCNAKRKQGPGLCRRPAGWGTDHVGLGPCKLHGGATRSHRQAAVKTAAANELARMDVAPVADPLTALAEIAGQVVAWKDALAVKVNQLTALRYTDAKGAEQLRSEVALFERALDRCEKFLSTMARLNIDERLAAIEQEKVEMVSAALTAVLGELGLSEQQQSEARRGVARRLRVVAG